MKIIEVFGNEYEKILDRLIHRGDEDFFEVDKIVNDIIHEVRESRDEALFAYTKKFDKADLMNLKVSQQEMEDALTLVDAELVDIMKEAAENIRDYHQLQTEKTWLQTKSNGAILGQLITPIQKVGVYVPGGKAIYPSTLLMNVIPAQVAGVKSITIVTPPDKNGNIDPKILVAASILKIKDIYKVGGEIGRAHV